MFKKTSSINDAFRHIRLFSIVLIIGNVAICCYTIYYCANLVKTAQSRIYILANGKALETFAADRKDNIAVEARDHVKTFHQLFFSLDPDEKVIQANVTKALYLADGSAKRAYDDLKENGYYTNIIAGNISQEIAVDSVQVDLNQYPHRFRCFATQHLIRATSTVSRLLITEGFLRNVSRSDNNPHGFLIERWTTIENRDINISNR
jgi:conjugative transposon TraK protein